MKTLSKFAEWLTFRYSGDAFFTSFQMESSDILSSKTSMCPKLSPPTSQASTTEQHAEDHDLKGTSSVSGTRQHV